MTKQKWDRFVHELREQLKDHPAFTDDYTGTVLLRCYCGGLAGETKLELVVRKNGKPKVGADVDVAGR